MVKSKNPGPTVHLSFLKYVKDKKIEQCETFNHDDSENTQNVNTVYIFFFDQKLKMKLH